VDGGTIKDHTCMHNDMHNPYVVRTGGDKKGFDWMDLKDTHPGLTDKILGQAGLRIEYTWLNQTRSLPAHLRPPGMPAEHEYWPTFIQKLVIDRSRYNICGHGPCDSLTVTFSERVDRRDYFLQYATEQGWLIDKEAIFNALDYTQTWTNVKKIRLLPVEGGYNIRYHMQLVQRDQDIVNFCLIPESKLSCTAHLKDMIAHRLTEGLQLRHAVVGGVHEYSV